MYVAVKGEVRSLAAKFGKTMGRSPERKRAMRAIFINAVGRKVEEVQIENKLEAFYEKIGCEMIQILHIGGSHIAIVDEEGRLRNWKVGFRFPKSEGIAGNALIVCEKPDGDFTDAKAPVELFQICTTFLDLKKIPLPPPAFGVAVISDLSPASIEKARAEALHDLEQHR